MFNFGYKKEMQHAGSRVDPGSNLYMDYYLHAASVKELAICVPALRGGTKTTKLLLRGEEC
jgi:hypothetical protein